MWQISHFCEIHSLSYEASKFFAMLSLCVFFGRYFAPGVNIVPPIAYKSHSTPFPIRPHVLTPHSWLCGKNCGRSSAPKFGQGRIVITILECTFPEENVNGACSGKKHHPVARVMYTIEHEPTTMSVRLLGCSGWLLGCSGWLLGCC